MKPFPLLLSIALCFCYSTTKAQDLHYSNYNFAPLYLNPANTGGFNGNIRVGAIHRDQSRTFINKAYQSTTLWADSPVDFIFNEKLWYGLGINLFSDKVGDLGFGMSGGYISTALHYSPNKDYRTIIAIGAQYGFIQRNFSKASAAQFGDELISGGTAGLDHQLLEGFDVNYVDLNLGFTLKHKVNETTLFTLGASAHHINDVFFSFPSSTKINTIESRSNLFTSLESQTTEKLGLKYAFYISQYHIYTTYQLQFHSKILLQKKGKKKSKTKGKKTKSQSYLTLGLGYRLGDALQFFAGGIHKTWEFGLSYDMTTSTANNYNNTVGGLELGVKKLFGIYTKPKINIIQICPRV